MSTPYSIKFDADANLFRVGGELTFSTVKAILQPAQELFESATVLEIDLADVERSDSAGLALLVDWMRTAKNSNKKIIFHNVPAQMLAIANASGLDELLPVE